MKISQNCLDIIKKWEGYKSDAYLDPVGIPTIGYGTIRFPNGKKVKLGDKISEAEAEAFLKFEVDEVVDNLAETLKGIAINQNQFDAVVSLCYNIGVGGFRQSTILKKLKEGDFPAAAAGFDLWNKGTINGEKKPLQGLTNRRREERDLFEKAGGGGMPIVVDKSPQDTVNRLEGYRDGDNNVVVALADDKVVEILVLKSSIKDDLITLLHQYKNAKDFNIAPPEKAIPDGQRTEINNKSADLPNVENPPKLERGLIIIGARDSDDDSNGSDVKELQLRLKDLGYYSEKVDGIFGKATDVSVRSFQTDYFGASEADGKVGPKTWGKLWGSASAPVIVEGTFTAGKNYLKLTNTNVKDSSGCFKLKFEYFKDGQSKDSLIVNSGQPKRQFFRTGKDSPSASFEPLPEGKWLVNNIQWKNGKNIYDKGIWQPGIGPAKILLDYVPQNGTRRALIEIHIDWNKNTAPGTAGCIGIQSISDFKRFVGWLRESDPRDLYVDWGLGSVNLP